MSSCDSSSDSKSSSSSSSENSASDSEGEECTSSPSDPGNYVWEHPMHVYFATMQDSWGSGSSE